MMICIVNGMWIIAVRVSKNFVFINIIIIYTVFHSFSQPIRAVCLPLFNWIHTFNILKRDTVTFPPARSSRIHTQQLSKIVS